MLKWLRRYDLEYWQMREALGFPIPNWVDRRWPRQLQGNAGTNPYMPRREPGRILVEEFQ